MGTRTRLLALAAGLLLALAPTADAATPFTAGTGHGHDLAVGNDGTGHVAWLQDESPGDRVHYCRVPAGGSACDGESTVLSFPGATSGANATGDAQIFTPAANKVVIVASCWNCNVSGVTDRTYRWISTNNGVDFSAPAEVGNNLHINGQAGYINGGDMTLGTEGSAFQMTDTAPPTPDTATAALSGGGLFVYKPSVVFNDALDRTVWAVSDLDTVKFAFSTDPTPTAAELNNQANWQIDRLLPGAEGDNDETHLSTGPNGIFLSYKWFLANDSRVGLRKFDPSTNTFGAPTYVEGPDPIDNNSLDYPNHSQDGSGRLHFVWRTLHDDNRLRYTRSDDGGATFTPAANLAIKETFIDPIVEASPAGTGFAIWRGIGESGIRVVVLDPQPEPAGPAGPDTTPPTVGSPSIDDPTLTPGQGTRFRFISNEAGIATLTVQKQVKGLKVKVRGKRKCVPQTKKRLRALRRRAGSPAAFRRLLRKRRCKAWKKIGSIRQAVVPGQNTIVFSGRIAGRRLRPGRYRAVLVIRDTAGNLSRAERVLFRVFRPRR